MAPSPSEQMQSFVIRVWVEEPVPKHADQRLYGHVVHVASGRRRYFDTLEDAFAFVVEQLGQARDLGNP